MNQRGGCIGEFLKLGFVAVVIIIVGIAVLAMIGRSSIKENEGVDLLITAKRWARHNLADRDAEVTGVTSAHTLGGKQYCAMSVRGKNVFGGPVANVFILELLGNNISVGYRPKEFRALLNQTKSKLQNGDAAKLERDYRAMCYQFGISPVDP